LATSVLGQPQSNGCAYLGVFATSPIVGTVKRAEIPRLRAAARSALAPLLVFGSPGTGLQ
jgi:hypothetical protein